MYRVRMLDSSVNSDVAAASAVHRELGPEYTDAVSEGLVERIGSEIDKRVDARLAERDRAVLASRIGWQQLTMTLGSIGLGACASAAVLSSTETIGPSSISNSGVTGGGIHSSLGAGQILLVAIIWAVIAVINLSYSRRR
jgi:hypothetical protein